MLTLLIPADDRGKQTISALFHNTDGRMQGSLKLLYCHIIQKDLLLGSEHDAGE